MKIANLIPEGFKPSGGTSEVNGKKAVAGARLAGRSTTRDSVSLSSDAIALAEAIRGAIEDGNTSIAHSPAELEALRQSISTGDYDVDPQAIAAAILVETGLDHGGRHGKG